MYTNSMLLRPRFGYFPTFLPETAVHLFCKQRCECSSRQTKVCCTSDPNLISFQSELVLLKSFGVENVMISDMYRIHFL